MVIIKSNLGIEFNISIPLEIIESTGTVIFLPKNPGSFILPNKLSSIITNINMIRLIINCISPEPIPALKPSVNALLLATKA